MTPEWLIILQLVLRYGPDFVRNLQGLIKGPVTEEKLEQVLSHFKSADDYLAEAAKKIPQAPELGMENAPSNNPGGKLSSYELSEQLDRLTRNKKSPNP